MSYSAPTSGLSSYPHSLRLLLLTAALLWPATLQAQTGVSDDRVSLPDGPGSIEGVGDNVDVDPNMGLLSYGVPIDVPEGFSGMTPPLSLSYSSGGGASVAGFGWGFGAPSIERQTLRGLPLYTADDEFTADSAQLVLVEPGSPALYRERFESSFARYWWHDAGTDGYWRVEYPDGRVGYFGADSDGSLVTEARLPGAQGIFRYHLVEEVDVWGHHVDYRYELSERGTIILAEVGWVFPSEGGDPHFRAEMAYEERLDVISDCEPGVCDFTDVRLTSISLFAANQQIRRYELGYEDYTSAGGMSRLSSVTRRGIDDSVHPIAFDFAYSQALGAECDGSNCPEPYVVDMGDLGLDFRNGDTTLVDLTGDGLADLVDSSLSSTPHRIFINELDPDYSPTNTVGTHRFAMPISSDHGTWDSHELSSPYVQIFDADGDGFSDLLNTLSGEILWNKGQGDWLGEASMWSTEVGLPDLDLDFDLGEGELRTIRFLDYNEDRLIDVLRSRGAGDSNITTIWRNTGGGFVVDDEVAAIGAGFDTDELELADMNGDGMLDMVQLFENTLRLRINLGWGQWQDWVEISGNFTLTNVQATQADLEDLNGDGLDDLVLVAADVVRYWINRSGERFDDERQITRDMVSGLPERTANTTVLFADMNGNGSADVVWIEPSGPTSYLEIFPVRPNLLVRIENNIGMVIDVTYGTSVLHEAEDGSWAYPLPFPMVVVDEMDHYDLASNVHRVATYDYHDGFYDGVEKQFRGFEMVEVTVVGDASREEGTTELAFDVGMDDPYYAGRQLTTSEYSDGRLIQRGVMAYDDCEVADVPDEGLRFEVRYICNITEELHLAEGLPESEWITLRKEMVYDGYGNVELERDLGVVAVGGGGCGPCRLAEGEWGEYCGDECLGDELYNEIDYINPDNVDGHWILGLSSREQHYADADADDYTERVQYFDGEPFVGLPEGQATRGFLTRVSARVETDDTMVDTARNRVDEHGNVVERIDPLGEIDGDTHRRVYTMDGTGLYTTQVDILTHDADGPYIMRRDTAYSLEWGVPTMVSEWRVVDGSDPGTVNPSFLSYDAFGRMSTLVKPGELANEPTAQYEYDLGSPVSRIIERSRSVAGEPFDMERITCLDGFGRPLQVRTRVDDGLYVVDGMAVFSVGGDERQMAIPYTSTSDECETSPPEGVLLLETRFDAMGRRTVQTFGMIDGMPRLVRNEYRPLERIEYDREDTRAGSPHFDTPTIERVDGQERTMMVGRTLEAGAEPEWYHVSWSPHSELRRITDPAGITRWQNHDLMGRVTEVADPDRGDLTFEYDAVGNLVRQTNGDGVIVEYSYDGANRVLERYSAADPESTRIGYHYDRSEHCPGGGCTFVGGQVAAITYPVLDSVGAEYFGYDARGNATHIAREIDGYTYEFALEYDHAGRHVATEFPTGDVVRWNIDDSGRITGVVGYVDEVSYSEQGDVAQIDFANGVTTANTRDPLRVIDGITTTLPDGTAVMDLLYERDAETNLLEVLDLRDDRDGPLASASYTYDAFYRLTGAVLDPDRSGSTETLSFSYDRSENLTSRESSRGDESGASTGTFAYAGPQPHALTTAGGVAYEYDAAGRLTRRGEDTLNWDHIGRLTSVTRGGLLVAEYGYGDSDERLIVRSDGGVRYYVTDDFEVRDGVASIHVMLGEGRVAELETAALATELLADLAPANDPDGMITAADAWLAYASDQGFVELEAEVPDDQVDSLLYSSARQGLNGRVDRVTFIHEDQLQSVSAVTDAAGELVEYSVSYPYGERFDTTTPVGFEERTLTGNEYDVETGFVYFGERYYDPGIGRWISADPFFETLNDDLAERPWEAMCGYCYALNNPTSLADLDGEWVFNPFTAVIGAVATLGAEIYVRHKRGESFKDWKTWAKIAGNVAYGGVMAGFTHGFSMIGQGIRYGAEIRGHLSDGSREDKRKTQHIADTVGAGVTGGLYLVSAIMSFASGDILGGISSIGGIVDGGIVAVTGESSMEHAGHLAFHMLGMEWDAAEVYDHGVNQNMQDFTQETFGIGGRGRSGVDTTGGGTTLGGGDTTSSSTTAQSQNGTGNLRRAHQLELQRAVQGFNASGQSVSRWRQARQQQSTSGGE